MTRFALAIHGGCGVMEPHELDEATWIAARADLATALRRGWAILAGGGAAIDAVEAAVVVMEDSPHFNAGHGAALNAAGEHELDSSIMDGATLAAGAVAGVRRIRNPVLAARAVLRTNQVVLMIGGAADRFAEEAGLAIVDPDYFSTTRRRESLKAMQQRQAEGTAVEASEADKHGTVGAVALDAAGHLAAATSTGGYTNKPEGRVGDSPIIGAGTYARDGVCAVSGTGQGELFIRHVLGHEIASRIAYLGETVEAATNRLVLDDLRPYGIGAGAVAIGADASIAAPFNTSGMFRGWVTAEGELWVGSHAKMIFVERLAAG
jgi:beta-aspartyl-peptidase (threonine type)